MGYLAQRGGAASLDTDTLIKQEVQRAIVHGSVVASFTVEGFGLDRLCTLTQKEIMARYRDLREYTNFEPTCPWLDDCEHVNQAE
jgi:hypothetical protein